MDALLDPLLALASSPWFILVVFALAVVDGLLPPVPSETVIVGAAALAASTGGIDVVPLAAAAAAGAFTGDNLVYALGRAVGPTRFRWMRGPRGRRAVAAAEHGLARGGASAILIARYIPVGRVAVNLTAGVTGYPRARFMLLSAVAATTWAAYSVAIGWLTGSLLPLSPLWSAVIGIGIAVVLGLVVDRVLARRRRGQPPSRRATTSSTGRQPTVVTSTTSREST